MRNEADESAARARLLAHYEQREIELVAKLERVRASMAGMTKDEEHKAKIQVGRLTSLVEENRAKAAAIRDTLSR